MLSTRRVLLGVYQKNVSPLQHFTVRVSNRFDRSKPWRLWAWPQSIKMSCFVNSLLRNLNSSTALLFWHCHATDLFHLLFSDVLAWTFNNPASFSPEHSPTSKASDLLYYLLYQTFTDAGISGLLVAGFAQENELMVFAVADELAVARTRSGGLMLLCRLSWHADRMRPLSDLEGTALCENHWHQIKPTICSVFIH